MSNFKAISKLLAFAPSSSENDKSRKGKGTLLKQSKMFRTQFPEKWEKRQEELKKRDEEAIGIFRMSPFIKSLYAEQSAKIEARQKQQDIKRHMPRRIKICVLYSTTPKTLHKKEENGSPKHYSVYHSKAEKPASGLIDSLKHVVTHDDVDSGPELRVTVEGCQYLHNGIDDMDERSEKCRVKAHLFPDCTEHSQDMETEYRYIASFGSTRWYHDFIFSGFRPIQIQQRHIVLTVFGRNHSSKICLGQVVISGKNAFIKQGENSHRIPTQEEIVPIHEALTNPGKLHKYMLTLKPEEINVNDSSLFNIDINFGSKTNTFFKRKKQKKGKPGEGNKLENISD